MAKREMPTEVAREEVVVEQNEVAAKEVPKQVVGVVCNCTRLNVRKKPTKAADVVAEVKAGTELTVNLEKSVGDWYKVCDANGLRGFCMKMYITLNQ